MTGSGAGAFTGSGAQSIWSPPSHLRQSGGVLLALPARGLLRRDPFQGMGGALGHAGGLEAAVDAILAVVALHDLARGGVPLGHAPWAGSDARLAADAQGGLDEDDAGPGAPLHRARGARRGTPRLLAVEAGHEHEGQPGNAGDRSGAH